MKQVLVLIMCLVSFNSVASSRQDYKWCIEEVEEQHADDKKISVKEYNDMIKECAFESEQELDKSDLKTEQFLKAHQAHDNKEFNAKCLSTINKSWKHLCNRKWFHKCVELDKHTMEFCINNH